jgi:hypothetical protein
LDLSVAISLWALLAIFRFITDLVPIVEAAGRWIRVIHSVGVVTVFGVLAGAFVWDIVQIKRRERL